MIHTFLQSCNRWGEGFTGWNRRRNGHRGDNRRWNRDCGDNRGDCGVSNRHYGGDMYSRRATYVASTYTINYRKYT